MQYYNLYKSDMYKYDGSTKTPFLVKSYHRDSTSFKDTMLSFDIKTSQDKKSSPAHVFCTQNPNIIICDSFVKEMGSDIHNIGISDQNKTLYNRFEYQDTYIYCVKIEFPVRYTPEQKTLESRFIFIKAYDKNTSIRYYTYYKKPQKENAKSSGQYLDEIEGGEIIAKYQTYKGKIVLVRNNLIGSCVSALPVDMDVYNDPNAYDNMIAFVKNQGIEAFFYTTYSWGLADKSNRNFGKIKYGYRFIIPFSFPVPYKYYKVFLNYMKKIYPGLDQSTSDVGRLFYDPINRPDLPCRTEYIKGKELDVHEIYHQIEAEMDAIDNPKQKKKKTVTGIIKYIKKTERDIKLSKEELKDVDYIAYANEPKIIKSIKITDLSEDFDPIEFMLRVTDGEYYPVDSFARFDCPNQDNHNSPDIIPAIYAYARKNRSEIALRCNHFTCKFRSTLAIINYYKNYLTIDDMAEKTIYINAEKLRGIYNALGL